MFFKNSAVVIGMFDRRNLKISVMLTPGDPGCVVYVLNSSRAGLMRIERVCARLALSLLLARLGNTSLKRGVWGNGSDNIV